MNQSLESLCQTNLNWLKFRILIKPKLKRLTQMSSANTSSGIHPRN